MRGRGDQRKTAATWKRGKRRGSSGTASRRSTQITEEYGAKASPGDRERIGAYSKSRVGLCTPMYISSMGIRPGGHGTRKRKEVLHSCDVGCSVDDVCDIGLYVVMWRDLTDGVFTAQRRLAQ